MKRLILPFAAMLLLGECTKESNPAAVDTRTGSIQKYSIPAFADSAAFDRMKQFFPVVDKLYKDYAEKNHFPSIAYGVVVGDQLVYSGATGIGNVKDNRAASTKMLYRIASMSKSFTGMAIMKLRDDGKLSLGEPVSKYIPEFSGGGALTADAPPITILNLLTMSAGFPEDNPWGDRQLDDTDKELLDQVNDGISFSNVPGVTFEYSNMGFALLGKIISNVSGMPYQQYITNNIMKPIGMNDSKWEYSEIPADVIAPGYRWEDETWKEEPLLHDGAYGAMGGLVCSIEDFAKYISLHLSAWPPRNETDKGPVKRSSIREMHQPWRVVGVAANARTRTGIPCPTAGGYGYGLGWRQDCNGNVRISHSGGLPGYGSEWRIYPEYNMGVVSFSNHTYGAPGFPNGVVLDTLIQLAGIKKRALPASEILIQRRDEIVSILPNWERLDARAMFAENFWLDSDVEHRKVETQKVFAEAGEIVSVSDVKPENQLRGTFTILCKKKNIRVFFTLTPEPAAYIQQLDIQLE
ncbi:MAG TPA: serine hydrolase domain-containing protein [Cyclobacteriaceae bacterium]|nr:serine hydrolase domain-containing protein [Cyclobacteriaceae bacterium]